MNWKKSYDAKKLTAGDAVNLIKSGDKVLLGHCSCEPIYLVDAMINNADAYRNVTVSHMYSHGENLYSRPEYAEHFRFEGFFCSAGTRNCVNEGRGDFVPVHFSLIPEYLRRKIFEFDVMMVMLSAPNEDGYCCIGVDSSYTYQAVKSAKLVLAQINNNVPNVQGDTMVHVDELDAVVEYDSPLPEVFLPEPGPVELAIGRNCAKLIRDGATLQLGIGTIPDAVLASLKKHKHLGIHSEMIADGVVELAEMGVIDCSEKSINKGRITVTSLMGTQKLFDFCNDNPLVELRSVDYVNDPYVIAQNRNMVSINSAIEVDFMGQVVADTVGKNQFSGVGGQVDFIRGTQISQDGKGISIIALPSVAKDRAGRVISRIVPRIKPYAAVTTTRNDIDYVVTEYGIAELKGKNLRDRAKRLIEIAHPDFRQEFQDAFDERYNP